MSELHIDSVTMKFGERSLLSDIFLSCRTGDIVGLLGRNGSGKSTLMKIIFGSVKAQSSFVGIDQTRIKGLSDGYRYMKYLPQNGFLPRNLKIRTIIKLFCSNESAKIVSEHHLIKHHINKTSRELSEGERRFFEVLLLLYSDSEFVLIDEPFNGMSPILIEEIKRHIKIQAYNKGLIITDHNYHNILDIATRVVLLHDGAIKPIENDDDLKKWGYIG